MCHVENNVVVWGVALRFGNVEYNVVATKYNVDCNVAITVCPVVPR